MLKLRSLNLGKDSLAALVIPVCEDHEIHDNRTVSALARRIAGMAEFKGQAGETLTLHDPPDTLVGRLIFMGMGKKEKLLPESLRTAAGKAVRGAVKSRLETITFAVPSAAKTGIDGETLLSAMLEGAGLGNHIFDRFKKEKKLHPLKEINMWVKSADVRRFSRLAETVEILCRATHAAREWVSLPANEKRPEQYAAAIVEKAREAGLAATVLEDAELRDKGFGALLAVSRGSDAGARIVILEYHCPGAEKTVALVGKGVTFDTGGLNLKISGSMTDMKTDMAGSAAVAATLIALSALKPRINVVGVLPIVENMVSGSAVRPGDIVRSYAGKTVEIGNTDAEGRLILIDAMAYAIETYKPHAVIDIATLTGACMVALGEKIAGLFTPDADLAQIILAAAEKTGERCWRMPLPEDYRELMKSDFADINNMSSSKYGGAITAALFLSGFVKSVRWAHIDIAGPAYAKKESDYCGPGGTGFGVRLLHETLVRIL